MTTHTLHLALCWSRQWSSAVWGPRPSIFFVLLGAGVSAGVGWSPLLASALTRLIGNGGAWYLHHPGGSVVVSGPSVVSSPFGSGGSVVVSGPSVVSSAPEASPPATRSVSPLVAPDLSA